jgi:hypothetical protein
LRDGEQPLDQRQPLIQLREPSSPLDSNFQSVVVQ